jgi:hypothetical protein
VAGQERLKPQEDKNEEDRSKVDDLRSASLDSSFFLYCCTMQGMAMDVSRSAGVCRAPSLFTAPPIVAPTGMHSFVYLEDPRAKTLCGSLSDSLKLVRRQRDSIMHISCSALNDS